ncbi:MAG: Cof-type HAD-IIB family hydrolase [Eubacteriales bacterium]|jgi:Cof subfamily protein (haloacid dehalogenase superfamily)|nr:Cof-type HAD-IIB family hydrolase [Eubacteriales bacterium]MDD3110258.1 Cof-type HAD-IIB family hydrolase [Eubacteriales bacterium]MDD3571320.1 Cof-type HAD-IIB family hydrolase [Eubacteriales bacterium]MDD4133913.1 Cof-type HAD-IIB family hydrolase [Eubacteriales bacterium]NLO14253.1 HAD family phosphatase [Clostridiales bacterium]
MKPAVRLIAADMDGTLLNEHSLVSRRTAGAIRAARRKGIQFAACTGRFPDNASMVMLDAGIEGPIISLNGCVIYDKPLGNILTEHVMLKITAQCAIDVLESLNEGYFIFAKNAVFARYEKNRHHSETDFVDRKEIKDRVKYYYGREACLDAVKHPIYKFYVYHSEGGHSLGEIREALDCVPTHSLTQSSANNIEIMPSNISKGTGLRDLAERLEIEPENILALGDQLNDVPMLEFAGISVAMGNAAQAVKDTAVHLTASNMDDGVAEAIHRFCL